MLMMGEIPYKVLQTTFSGKEMTFFNLERAKEALNTNVHTKNNIFIGTCS